MTKENEKDPDQKHVQNRMDLLVSVLDVVDQTHVVVQGITEDPEVVLLVLIEEDVADLEVELEGNG